MAERNHLRIADQNDLPNDDPFAELTRIMGFDPRQTARPRPAQDPAEAIAGEDDFGIDLEKELMGELEAEEAAPDAQAASQPYQDGAYQNTAEPAALDAAASAELDEASFEIAAFEDELAASLQEEPSLSEADAVHDEQIAAAFEDELAASLQDVTEADAVHDEQVATAFEEEFSLADDFMAQGEEAMAEAAPAEVELAEAELAEAEPVEAFDAVVTEASAADPEAAPAADLPEAETAAFETSAEAEPFEASAETHDFSFGEALEEELARDVASPSDAQPMVQAESVDDAAFAADGQESLGDESWEIEAGEEASAASGEPLAVQPSAPEPSDEPFADEFDTALAEVDMNFSAMRAAVDEHAPAADDGGLDRELRFRLDDRGEAEALAEPDLDEPAEERDELSLEDELNALLGNVAERKPAVAEVRSVEAVAEVPAEPVQPVAESAEEEMLDDLADDLDAVNWAFDAAEPAEAQSSAAFEEDQPLDPAVSADHGDFYGEDQDEQPAYAEVQEAPAYRAEADFSPDAADFDPDIDLEFDDEAFDAAISNGIAGDEPVPHGTEDSAAPAWREAEQPVVKENDDPYAALAALTASMRRAEPATSWRRDEPQPVAELPIEHQAAAGQDEGEADYAASAYEDFPDIETIDVPEQAVALADDLDIPELAAEEKAPQSAVYDDLDAEFAGLLSDMPETPAPAPAPAYHADDYAAEFERAFARQEQAHPVSSHAGPAAFAAGLAGGAAFAGASHAAYGSAADTGRRDVDYVPGGEAVAQEQSVADELSYDPDLDEDMSMSEYGATTREQPQRRGMLVAAIVGGVAVLGGIGAFAMSFGDAGSDTPAIVKADAEPIKVRPENPGGTTVPNQDKAVYDRVAGSGDPAQPKQEKLLTSAEEPIDVPAPRVAEAEAPASEAAADAPAARSDAIADTLAGVDLPQPAPANALQQAAASDLPGVTPPAKSEDRIEQVIEASGVDDSVEVAAVAPRKVRTMIVKADGTLVPREDPKPAAETPVPAPAANANAAESEPDATGTVPPAANAAAPATEAPQAPAETAASATPNSVPLAPARPSDQPVDIVGEVKADQVAALAPSSGANGGWSMQIASQPSEGAAQSSYQDLLRRYSGVLEGRQANIVKAEIAGKGTFWRVRVPAGSRSDAIKLCESYKSAGGNCFVSK